MNRTMVTPRVVELRFAQHAVDRVLAHTHGCTEHAPPLGQHLTVADVKPGHTMTPRELERGTPFSKLDLTRFPAGLLLSQDASGVFLMSNGLPETDPIDLMAVWAAGYGPTDDWTPVWEDDAFATWLPADTVADALAASEQWLTITVRDEQVIL